MKLHEQIYTSASELLDPSAGNLGVIAQTRLFPKLIDSELAAHRAYTLQDNLHNAPKRYAFGRSASHPEYTLLSQVLFGGADHTGRTTPFAHHIVVSTNELDECGCTMASLIQDVENHFFQQWNKSPEWLEPSRSIQPAHNASRATFSPLWYTLLAPQQVVAVLASIADALISYEVTQQPVVLCIPLTAANSVIEIVKDVFALTPPTVQASRTIVSHVVEVSDFLRNSSLAFTYSNTPFLEQCRIRHDPRRPIVFDICRPESLCQVPLGAYAITIAELIQKAGLTAAMEAARKWDQWCLTAQDRAAFGQLIEFHRGLSEFSHVDQLSELVVQSAKLSDLPVMANEGTTWMLEFIDVAIPRLSEDAQWQALAKVASDQRWPLPVQNRAIAKIADQPDQGLPWLCKQLRNRNNELVSLSRELAKHTSRNPLVIETAIRVAQQDCNATNVNLVVVVLENSDVGFDKIVAYLTLLADCIPDLQKALDPAIKRQLAATIRSKSQLQKLFQLSTSNEPTRSFIAKYCNWLLWKALSSAKSEDQGWIADHLIGVALQSDNAADAANVLHRLVTTCNLSINPQQIEAWIARSSDAAIQESLQKTATALNLIDSQQPSQVSDEAPIESVSMADDFPMPAISRSETPRLLNRDPRADPPERLRNLFFRSLVLPTLFVISYLFIQQREPLLFFILIWTWATAIASLMAWFVSVMVDRSCRRDLNRLPRAFSVRRWMLRIQWFLLAVQFIGFLVISGAFLLIYFKLSINIGNHFSNIPVNNG